MNSAEQLHFKLTLVLKPTIVFQKIQLISSFLKPTTNQMVPFVSKCIP